MISMRIQQEHANLEQRKLNQSFDNDFKHLELFHQIYSRFAAFYGILCHSAI